MIVARAFRELITEGILETRDLLIEEKGGSLALALASDLDDRKLNSWLSKMSELESRFNALKTFHLELFDGWDWLQIRRAQYWYWRQPNCGWEKQEDGSWVQKRTEWPLVRKVQVIAQREARAMLNTCWF